MPKPPEGQGPPLEWHYANGRARRWVLGVTSSLIAALLLARTIFASGSFEWAADWRVWSVVTALALLWTLLSLNVRLAAGADWLMNRKDFVKTYRLSVVKVEKNWDEGSLQLSDRDGNRLHVGLGWLRANEALWDLVYNGIQHSVARGAEVNPLAVQYLRLHDALAIREQRGS